MKAKSSLIFQKLSNFLKVSIFIAKMKRPIIPKLIFFKKSSKTENFELLHHYDYGFIRDFQFSPSTTPLFRRRSYSVLFPCRCIGNFGAEKEGRNGDYRVEEALPAMEGRLDWSDEEDDSIDRRAELFIEKFYADMRLERLESI